jgi:hypothetical protein
MLRSGFHCSRLHCGDLSGRLGGSFRGRLGGILVSNMGQIGKNESAKTIILTEIGLVIGLALK